MRHLIVAAALIFLHWTALTGQISSQSVSLKFPIVTEVNSGEEVCLPLSVEHFTDIVAMQWSVLWDPTLLIFNKIDNVSLPEMGPGNFNAGVNGQGVLSWNYLTSAGFGATVPDGVVIFDLCFQAVGPAGSESAVLLLGEEFNPSVPAEIFNSFNPSNLFETSANTPGVVRILGPVSTSQQVPPTPRLFPNPTTGPITLNDLPAGQWQYQLSDATGSHVANGALNGASLDLSGQLPGLYLLTLQSDEQRLLPMRVLISQ